MWIPAIASVCLATLFLARFVFDASWEESRTAMFTVLVLSHMLYAFVVQLDRPGRRPAPAATLLQARGLLVAVSVVVLPPAGAVLDTAALTTTGWLLCVVAALIPPVVMWLVMMTRHRSVSAHGIDARRSA